MGLFEIDSEGWKTQQKGREPWEFVRELIQNALDTEADIFIRVNTRRRKVTVEDSGQGFEDLSDAYTIFGGDKGEDPTKRGRFGRGLKETVGGAERVMVMTPDGTVEFDVPENERTEHDRTFSGGTRVVMENSEWSKEDMENIKDYVFKLWPPEGQKIIVDLKGGERMERERWEPDHSVRMNLQTVVVDAGVMTHEDRRARVDIKRADKGTGDGRIYEMGIPVSLNEPFPFYVDIQQKVPMAEQRNEPDSDWVKDFRPRLLNVMVDEMSKVDLRQDWVMEALSHYIIRSSTQRKFVDKVLSDDDKPSVLSGSREADDKCRNYGYNVIDGAKLAAGAESAAKLALPDADTKARELSDDNQQYIDPTPAQREFIEFAEGIAEELGYEDVTFETWTIEPVLGEDVPYAECDNGNRKVKLNVFVRDWDEVSADTVGTVVHELSHFDTFGHGKEWYTKLQDNFAELLVERIE